MKALRLDPRTKLFLILLCVLSSMFAPSLYFQLVLTALIGLLAALSGEWRHALRGILAYGLICAFTVWCMGVLSGVWQTMFIAFLGLVHKVYACGMLAGLVISTTKVGEFLSAMARLHVPKKLTIPIAVMLRYLPTIREDWCSIRDAMRLRDVSPTLTGFLKAPAMTVNCIYVPLLTAASKAADELSIASVTRGMDNLSGLATRVTMFVTEGIVSTAVMTLAVFLFDWRVGLLIAVGLLIYYLVNHALQLRSEEATRRKLAGDTAVVEGVLEYIKGIAEAKSYSLTGKYNRRLESAIDENAAANIDMELKLQPLMWAQNAVAKLIDVGVVVLSLTLYTGGKMELLNCVMLCICSFLLTEGLEQAGMQSSLLRVVDTCVNQATDILDLPAVDISGAELKPEHYDLRAEDIRFSYGEKPIINGVTLDIPERTTTAIVGPSGGGKTTLCHLLSRFWDVDGGHVTLGGYDVRDYDMDSLMQNFSFVFQNVYLFHDTIANNIRFGQPDAPIEKVMEAAKKARSHDFIMKLPQGYDTVIGESGGTLSGGERQRLSIARAMMKDAPIIILDEATANVDPENEKELMEAIQALTREKTVIMIAHRLKTVRHADQILVVDKGQIVQRGTHDALMTQDGIYRRFISGREQAVGWKL